PCRARHTPLPALPSFPTRRSSDLLDIYATSIDYDPKAESSQLFFKTVQNKMHWAAHGHTAAEVVVLRADASKPNMGLTSWTGDSDRKSTRLNSSHVKISYAVSCSK